MVKKSSREILILEKLKRELRSDSISHCFPYIALRIGWYFLANMLQHSFSQCEDACF